MGLNLTCQTSSHHGSHFWLLILKNFIAYESYYLTRNSVCMQAQTAILETITSSLHTGMTKMRFQNYMTLNLTRHYKNLSIDQFSTCILQKQYLDKWVKVEDIKHDRHINEWLSDISVHWAKEVQGHRQLKQKAVHHHKVSHTHFTY